VSSADSSADRPRSGHDGAQPVRSADVPAVIYGAKSTEDRRGSIETQLADCRAMARREGWRIVGEYHDEGFSAYSGNRGPGLAAAREHAARTSEESGDVVMLVVQHSDRISRGAGDRPGAAEALVEIWHAERRRNVHLRSVQDDFDLRTSASVANMGERNRADSERKGLATRDGLQRRKESGRTVGAVPLGYVPRPALDEDGRPRIAAGGVVENERVIDEVEAAVVRRILRSLADGAAPGEVARELNAEGIPTKRAGVWAARAVRELARCEAFVGRGGYARIVDDELYEAAQAALAARRTRRRGGPRARNTSFVLREIGRCGLCGSPLYPVEHDTGARRYACKHTRIGSVMCAAPRIRADVLEAAVIAQIERCQEEVERFIEQQVAARSEQRDRLAATAERERETVAELERKVARAQERYDAALDDDELADAALRQVARLEGRLEAQRRIADEVTALAAEWHEEPDVQAAREWLDDLLCSIVGRLEGTEDRAAVLRSVIGDVNAHVEGHSLTVRTTLRAPSLRGLELILFTGADRPAWVLHDDEDEEAEPDGSPSSTVGCFPDSAVFPTGRTEPECAGLTPPEIRGLPRSASLRMRGTSGRASTPPPSRPIRGSADSSGHCNSSSESCSRRGEAETLARALVEYVGDGVELDFGDGGEVNALGEVLPEQPVGVLVAPALPRRVGVAEEHRAAGVDVHLLAVAHLRALVPGQRPAQRRGQRLHLASEGGRDVLGLVAVGQRHQHREAAGALARGRSQAAAARSGRTP
jgi:DNA invertase Pin-like site-specific DNA recombinase